MENLEQLNKNVETKATEVAKNYVETAKAGFDATVDTVKTEITEKLENTASELQKGMDDLNTKFETIKVSTTENKGKTLKGMLEDNSDRLKSFGVGKQGTAMTIKLDVDSDVMKTLSYGGTGELQRVPMEYRDSEIYTNPHFQTSVAANLYNATAANNDLIRFVREESPTNAAAGKAHGAAFAPKNIDLRNHSETVVTIGEFIRLNEEQLSDVLGLRAFIQQELMGDLMDRVDTYILGGTGSGNNQLNGFNQTGQHTDWADQREAGDAAIAQANNIDVLLNGVSQLESANYKPDVIFVSPASFWGPYFTLAKSGDGSNSAANYVGRQIAEKASTGVMPMLAGCKIVRTNAITDDSFYIVDSKKAAKLWTVEGTEIEFARSGDDFENNQVSARIKCRKALTVGRPSGILMGDFSTARGVLAAASV